MTDEGAGGELSVAGGPGDGITLDGFGVLRRGGRWVALSDAEAILLGALLGHLGAVVARTTIQPLLWPGEVSDLRRLDSLVHRLRRRIQPFGLAISTIRGRGYLLEVSPSAPGTGDD